MQLPAIRTLDKYLGYLLIAALLPVTRLLGILLRKNHQLQEPPKHILFIKLLGLGSLLVATDPIQAIRQQYPHTKFILLTDSNIANGIAPFKVFDTVWSVDTKHFPGTIRSAIRFLIQSWKLQHVWVVDLEVYSKLTTVYALLTCATNRFGFLLLPVFFRKYLNTHNVPFNQSAFLEDNYYQMAQAITGHPVLSPPPVVIRKEEKNKPYILVNNSCSDLALTRKLPNHTFAAICTWILEHTAYRLAFMGTAKDREDIELFIAQHSALQEQKHKLLNIAGAFDFEGYYQFMSDQGVCLVTIDSGPLHMARKLGVPTVSVWGPTSPANHLKIKAGDEARHVYQYAATSCSPCVHRYDKLPCGGNNFCMQHVSATAIVEQIRTLLNQLNQA